MMKRRWARHFFSVLGLVLAGSAIAESAEEKGLAIAIEADQRDQGWIDSQVQMEMVLRNAKGNESKRRVRLKTLEVNDDGDKSLTIFDTPADIKGYRLTQFFSQGG